MPADVAQPPGWSGWSGSARVVRGHDVLEERCVGPAVGRDGPPCGPETRYQAGSIGKLVLAAVVLRLVERGELELGRPIGRWLAPAPAAWRATTLHQLLSHTSGLGHWGDVPGLGTASLLTAPPPRAELVALVERAPLVHAPGAGWRYSGPGYLVAAFVVEAVTGRAYGDVAADLVLGPAQLTATTSGHFPVGAPDVAVGHLRGGPVAVHEGFSRLPGTGDLWTTVGDLVRLGQALRSGRVVGADLVSQLWTPHARLPPADAGDGPVVVEAYGYGTFLGRVNGRPARINPGDNPGYQSLLAHVPDADLDLAVLCNEDAPSVDAALGTLTSV